MQLCLSHPACQEVSGTRALDFSYIYARQNKVTRPGVDQGGSKAAASGKAALVRIFLKRRLPRQALSSGLQRLLRSCREWRLPTVLRLPDFP